MAKALQCPNCGHRHPLADVADTSSFACVSCGQVLKVPAAYRKKPAEGQRPVASSAAAPRPPAPPRTKDTTQSMDRAAVAAAAAAAAGSAAPRPGPPPAPSPSPAPARTPVASSAPTTPPPPPGSILGGSRRDRRQAVADDARLGRGARFLVWLVAIPLAFLIVIVPARLEHFITGANLVGVVAGTGFGRYLRLAVVTLIWALVAAALVTVTIVMIERRRSRPAGDPTRRGGGNGSTPPSDGSVARGGSAASRSARPPDPNRQPIARS